MRGVVFLASGEVCRIPYWAFWRDVGKGLGGSVLAKKGAGNAYPFLNRCSVELYPTRKGVRGIEKKGKPLPTLGQKSA